MRESITDAAKNLDLNRSRWGDFDAWADRDDYGYRWAGGVKQTVGGVAKFCDRFLRPFTDDRYDHTVLEIAPGGGRFTAELVRYAGSLDLMDMNSACLEICLERFRYLPMEFGTFLNDGQDCSVLGDNKYSLIASFDSFVHIHPTIIESYVHQLSGHLLPGGRMWIDHSGKGAREQGHRTDMTPEKMEAYGDACGLITESQEFRNDHDCITVFRADQA